MQIEVRQRIAAAEKNIFLVRKWVCSREEVSLNQSAQSDHICFNNCYTASVPVDQNIAHEVLCILNV